PQYSEANVCGSPYKTNRDFLHLMRNCRCGTIPISPSDVYSCSCCIVTNANPSAKVKTHGRIRLEVRFEKSYSEHGVLACIFRIRLLPRMNGVEALVGIRMQNTWVRNPPVEQWVETVPSHLRALAATN